MGCPISSVDHSCAWHIIHAAPGAVSPNPAGVNAATIRQIFYAVIRLCVKRVGSEEWCGIKREDRDRLGNATPCEHIVDPLPGEAGELHSIVVQRAARATP